MIFIGGIIGQVEDDSNSNEQKEEEQFMVTVFYGNNLISQAQIIEKEIIKKWNDTLNIEMIKKQDDYRSCEIVVSSNKGKQKIIYSYKYDQQNITRLNVNQLVLKIEKYLKICSK